MYPYKYIYTCIYLAPEANDQTLAPQCWGVHFRKEPGVFCAQWDSTIFDTNSYGVPCIVGQYHPFFASHVDLHCISCQISQLIDVLEILQETMWGFSSFNVSTIHSIPGNLPTLRSWCWYVEYASPFLVQFPMWSVETTNHPTSPTTSFFLCVLTINQRVPCSCSPYLLPPQNGCI